MPSTRPKIHLPLPVQGIRADLDDFHVPPDALRSTSHNWLLRNGKIVTRPGLTAFGQDTGVEPPIAIISFRAAGGDRHLIHSTGERWWRYNTGSAQWDDISDGALLWDGSKRPASFRVFNTAGKTYLLGVHGFDTPRAWDTTLSTNNFTLFGGSAPVSDSIAIVGDRVILGSENTVDASAFQDHTSGWGSTQTTVLLETSGDIVSMNELGANQVAIYKTDSIYIASATTGIAPLRFSVHTSNIRPPFSSTTVVPLRSDLHAIFTIDGELYLFDGITYSRHPSSDRIRTLYEQNTTREVTFELESHAHYNRIYNELWWFYTRVGEEANGPRDAIIVDLSNGAVWKAEFPFTFTSAAFGDTIIPSTILRSFVFMGRSNGQFYLFEGDTDAGNGISAHMSTGLSDLGEPTRAKTIEETEHYFTNPTSTQSFNIALLTSESGKPPTVSADQLLTVTSTSEGPYVTGHRSTGGERVTSRFVGLQIDDIALTAPLEYRGSSLTVVPRGDR